MKNLKASQLPEGSVIDDEKYGEYIKRADGVWEETSSDHMGDKDRITDTGYVESKETHMEYLQRYGWANSEPADFYFTNFKLIATAPGYDFSGRAIDIHGRWVEGLGGFVDGSRPHECKGFNCEF